jgi:hypothetical protein
MNVRGWLVGAVIVAAASSARAQPGTHAVAAAPSAPAPTVAAEPQDVKVGDVIMAPALEEPDVAEVRQKRETEAASATRWYGTPILIGDAIAYTCLFSATAIDESKAYGMLLPPFVLGYALTGPVTHAARGNWGRAGLSVLTRAGLPFTGLVLGASGCSGDGGGSCVDGVVGGLIVGMLAATAVDSAWIAREPVPRARPHVTLEPLVSVGSQHAFVGAAGAF